jgi:autotransporter-associated beta strand protein
MKLRPNRFLHLTSPLAIAVVTALSVSSSAYAQNTRTWDRGAGTDILNTAANWSSNLAPTGSDDTAQWNGTVAGNLVLSWNNSWGAGSGNLQGPNLNITGTQTGSLQIGYSGTLPDNHLFSVGNITIASGAGAFTFGDGVGVDRMAWRGTNTFTNNSANTATIASNVLFNSGSGASRTLTFAGSGNWTVNANMYFGNDNSLNVTKNDAGTLTIAAVSTYIGLHTVNGGALNVTSTGSLRSGTALTIGASGTADFANASQTLGAVDNANTATNALNFSASTGTITLGSLAGAGNTRFGSNGTITGGISNGTVNALGLLTANISGGTVGAGTLSSTTISGGTTTVSGVATIGTLSSGTANLNGVTSAITSLNGGTVNLGSSTVLSVSNGTHAGSITGSGGGLTKTSAGTLTLSNTGTYTYTGATNVNAGTLVVNGNISTSNFTVADGATIGGSGTVGALTIQSGGFVNAGNSSGILNTGHYNQVGTLVAEITGLTAGTQHDQINVSGTVTLSGALDLQFSASTDYVLNSMIFLILNDGVDAVSGTFSGLAQGSTAATFGGFDWIISYEANQTGSAFLGGNDVALRAIPEPSAALLGGLSALPLLRRRRR